MAAVPARVAWAAPVGPPDRPPRLRAAAVPRPARRLSALVCLALFPAVAGLAGCGGPEAGETTTLKYDPEAPETVESDAFDARMGGQQ